MRRASRLPYSLDQDAYARSVLGLDHPLVRAQAKLKLTAERCVVVSGMLAVGVFALIEDREIGAPLAGSASVVLAGLLSRSSACKNVSCAPVTAHGWRGRSSTSVRRSSGR